MINYFLPKLPVTYGSKMLIYALVINSLKSQSLSCLKSFVHTLDTKGTVFTLRSSKFPLVTVTASPKSPVTNTVVAICK